MTLSNYQPFYIWYIPWSLEEIIFCGLKNNMVVKTSTSQVDLPYKQKKKKVIENLQSKIPKQQNK